MLRLTSVLVLVTAVLVSLPVSSIAQDETRHELTAGIHPVIESPDGKRLVVVRVRTDPSWGRGPLRLVQREVPTVVDRAVDRRALPAAVRDELRRRFVLSDAHRAVCTARLGPPRLVRRVSPDFEYATWNGEEGGPRYTASEVAQAAWDLTEGWELLVAPAIEVRGDCARATWATRTGGGFGPASPMDESRVLAAFHALPGHRELADAWTDAREYDDDPTAMPWDARAGGTARRFVGFVANGRRFTLLVAHAHDGCGDFTGVLWALFEHHEAGPVLVVSERTHTFVPTSLVDLDGDGVPELIDGTRRYVVGEGLSADVEPLFLGCPC